jgi:5-methyltetrahydropteroyltriglutamate--homocysteine methyltransferase
MTQSNVASARGPFRADHVGSLLRPPALLAARADFAAGKINAAQLAAIEDQSITELVAKQKAAGLKSVTDGEFRRENWSLDFLSHLQGVKVIEMDSAPVAHGSAKPVSSRLKVATVVGKVGGRNHPMVGHFSYLQKATRATAKITIPAPTMIVSASRDWRQIVDRNVYPTLELFFDDLAVAYRQFIHDVYAQGCRYLQLDDVNMAFLCDEGMRSRLSARGDDPGKVLATWVRAIGAVLADRPADLTVTTHLCRGNFRSAWFAQGGYEPVADALFNQLDYDGYFLEYDSERAGGFEPLRFLPKGKKKVVLGLITSKTGELEEKALIRSRVEAAAKFAPLDQLCLSPQCGFASHEDGNLLSQADQWAKLERVVELSREIWPDA